MLLKQKIKINNFDLAYIDTFKITNNNDNPILLIHGNPTSSYLWRKIIPNLQKWGRVIIPDLIGHGDSDKLPTYMGKNRYSFKVTYDFLVEIIDFLKFKKKITLLIHDWGGALGFHWAFNNPEKILGIAYMETIVQPLKSWNDWPENARSIFQSFRSEKGEDLILNRNFFIERILPNSIIRNLSSEEMDNYRLPFKFKDDRQVMLNWPRQIPIEGEPKDIFNLVNNYSEWMQKTLFPKLFINAEPGSILVGNQREYCRKWLNQTEMTVDGLHFIQEDSPNEISNAFINWYKNLI